MPVYDPSTGSATVDAAQLAAAVASATSHLPARHNTGTAYPAGSEVAVGGVIYSNPAATGPSAFDLADWVPVHEGSTVDDALFQIDQRADSIANVKPTAAELTAANKGVAPALASGMDCLLYTSPSPRD